MMQSSLCYLGCLIIVLLFSYFLLQVTSCFYEYKEANATCMYDLICRMDVNINPPTLAGNGKL